MAALNGVGLGTADAPLALVRQLLYLPLIALAFLIGHRHQVNRPVLPLATAAVITVGAVAVDDLGQGMTMLVYSVLAVGLPWLIGQALRHQRELAALA